MKNELQAELAWYAKMAQQAKRKRALKPPKVTKDPHAAHHIHVKGLQVFCSCGEYHGVMTGIALPSEEEPVCQICGERGVLGWTRRAG